MVVVDWIWKPVDDCLPAGGCGSYAKVIQRGAAAEQHLIAGDIGVVTDPAVVLSAAQELLTWRAEIADRMMTGLLVEDGGIGRWPPLPEDWHRREPA